MGKQRGCEGGGRVEGDSDGRCAKRGEWMNYGEETTHAKRGEQCGEQPSQFGGNLRWRDSRRAQRSHRHAAGAKV